MAEWTATAPTPVPLPDWEAKDPTTSQWHPVIAITTTTGGELVVWIAPTNGRPTWLARPQMRHAAT